MSIVNLSHKVDFNDLNLACAAWKFRCSYRRTYGHGQNEYSL